MICCNRWRRCKLLSAGVCVQIFCKSQHDSAPVWVLPRSHHQPEAGGALLQQRCQGPVQLHSGGDMWLQQSKMWGRDNSQPTGQNMTLIDYLLLYTGLEPYKHYARLKLRPSYSCQVLLFITQHVLFFSVTTFYCAVNFLQLRISWMKIIKIIFLQYEHVHWHLYWSLMNGEY